MLQETSTRKKCGLLRRSVRTGLGTNHEYLYEISVRQSPETERHRKSEPSSFGSNVTELFKSSYVSEP